MGSDTRNRRNVADEQKYMPTQTTLASERSESGVVLADLPDRTDIR